VGVSMLFEFVIPKRPVSSQTKNRGNLQKWKKYVCEEAKKSWIGIPFNDNDLHLTLVCLCDEDPVDVDNIIKPIQDALIGTVYDDDLIITDVESHRRPFTGVFDVTKYSVALLNGILLSTECVYVRISDSKPLESYL
jgi:crossover junction endodeoxyribonuclease RusA